MDLEALRKKVDAVKTWVVETRRLFHQHPELGLEEHWTAQTVSRFLDEMGIPHRTGVAGTGVVGIIQGGRPGKTVALRADMDALPVQEETGLAYASRIDGKMHACGHDAHMAVLLGAAHVLNGLKEDLEGNVKLFFQPAEETDGGAKPMIEAGCMENPHVDYVLGMHVTPEAKTGQILIKAGQITAASDIFKLIVKGGSSHAAYPERGIDAVVLAAHVVTALQTVVSRNVSPLDSAVVTVGTIQGGTKENIIADKVRLGGTMRTLNSENRAVVKKRIRAIASGICESMGGSCDVDFEEGYKPIINDAGVARIIEANARALLGPENVLIKERPSMGVEDFSFFCACSPGAYYYLGCADPERNIAAPGHSPRFRIDEECLKTGVLLQVVNVLSLLGQGRIRDAGS